MNYDEMSIPKVAQLNVKERVMELMASSDAGRARRAKYGFIISITVVIITIMLLLRFFYHCYYHY